MIVEVGLTVPDPTTLQVAPSATVTWESGLCDRKLENILELPDMWFVAPELITHLFDEKKRHVFLDSENVVTEMGKWFLKMREFCILIIRNKNCILSHFLYKYICVIHDRKQK